MAVRWKETKPIKKGGGRAPPSFAALRLAELFRLFGARYGIELPDDDAGRDDLQVVLDHFARTRDAERRMRSVASLWAPWMPADELDVMIATAIDRPKRFKADTLAARLGLRMEERTQLGIFTIGAIDCSADDRAKLRAERARVREERRRRDRGAVRLDEYRRKRKAEKPWKLAGCSRATWYRRQRETALAA